MYNWLVKATTRYICSTLNNADLLKAIVNQSSQLLPALLLNVSIYMNHQWSHEVKASVSISVPDFVSISYLSLSHLVSHVCFIFTHKLKL